MGMIVMGGRHANILARGVVSVSDADSLFPAANLYDGDPGVAFRFGSAGADRQVTVDGDLSQGSGAFEDVHVSGAPPGWTDASTGAGALARDTVTFADGASSLRLDSGTGQAIGQRDFSCRAGEELSLTVKLRGDGTNAVTFDIQDLDTGQWLTSGGVWQNAATTVATRSVATFATTTLSAFSVSAMSAWPYPVRRLRVRFYAASGGSAQGWVDTFSIWPSFDFLAVHGHSIRPALTVQFRSSTDNFSASDTLEATVTPARAAFFSRLSAKVARRYARLKLVGTSPEAMYLGEMRLGQSFSLTRPATFPLNRQLRDAQVRVPRLGYGSAAYGLATEDVDTLELQFGMVQAEADEWLNEVWRRARGGFVFDVVPDSTRTEVYLGRWAVEVPFTWSSFGRYDVTVPFERLPLWAAVG